MFVILSLGLNNFINAQGFGKIGMMTVSIGAFINIALDPVFIFKMGMGVKGAAFATIISQFVSACWTMQFLIGKKSVIAIEKRYMKLKFERVKKILSLGFANFIMLMTNSMVQVMYNAGLQNYGGDLYVGIMTIINSVREVVQMPVNGISQSAQPIMGFNYGAKEFKRTKKTIRYNSIILAVYTGLMWLTIVLFPKFFLRMFTETNRL